MPYATHTLAINIINLLILLALLFPFASRDRLQLLSIVSIYRPLSLICMLISPLLILIAPFTTGAVIPIASVSVIWVMSLLALEVRASRNAVPMTALWFSLAIFVFIALVVEWGWDFGRSIPKNVAQLVSLISLLIGWIWIEAGLAYEARRKLHYMFVIFFAVMLAASMATRAWILSFEEHTFETMIFFETDNLFLTRAVSAAALLAISVTLAQLYLDDEWKSELSSRKKAEEGLLMTLCELSSVRDEETGNHIKCTSEFAKSIAQNLRDRSLLEEDGRYDIVDIMRRSAPLHDVGKIGIPDEILKKPGKLDADEWEIMKTHSSIGEEVLKAAVESRSERSGYMDRFLDTAVKIAGGHHENWDGSGYPRGLAGENIPQAARIMALADVYDALTSARVYKTSWSHRDAVTEIERLSGVKLDPEVVASFHALEDTFKTIAEKYKD